MDGILHGLNANQRAAVTSSSSVLQVLAPPGSGKTKTLTARVAYLIAHEQLKPWNILTCTFTRKAANEMKERVRNFVGENLSKQIKLGTFHAIAVQYLRQYGQHIGLPKDFGIADSSDSKAILKRIIKRNKFTIEPGPALARISAQKIKCIDSEQLAKNAKHVEQQEFAQIFAEYEADLQASNLLDYDDLLLRCCRLMRTHPQCVSNVEAVLIDEFQDTNNIQYDLMGLFAQKRNVITIVGDPDQSIYGFRNAEIQNLARMKQHWPDTLTINLEENYRSSGAILHAAQSIIEQDESRPPKKLQATHTPGQRPVLRKLPSATGEANWVVSEITRMCALSGNVLTSSDFAILLRSAALSRVIEAALGKAGVPYKMVGGVKFFDRAEVRLVLDYLRVMDQPSHNEAVQRIINVPPRRIGDATVKRLHEEANSKNMSLWKLICGVSQRRYKPDTKLTASAEKGLSTFVNVIICGQKRLEAAEFEESEAVSVVDLINLIIKKIDLQAYLNHKYENEGDARWSNVEELIAQAADASDPKRLDDIAQAESLPFVEGLDQRGDAKQDTLSMFLANIALSAAKEEKEEEGGEPIRQVTISTIHSAKGLEWPIVFIPACYEGSIPHSRSDDNDEERRLLYVGMTRAQAMLYLSCPIKNTQREDTTMSSYLSQPGVSSYFEEHGPSISLAAATGLATTLKREPPSSQAYAEGKASLERDEDNYWPLNGDEPAEERAKWEYGKADNALPVFGTTRPASWVMASEVTTNEEGFSTSSTTMRSGFVSVKEQYDEILEKNRLEAIDKRAKALKKAGVEGIKGRKRQIEGQGAISSFFAKRTRASPAGEESSAISAHSFMPASGGQAPLREITNLNQRSNSHSLPTKSVLTTSHKIRTAPLCGRPQPQRAIQEPGFVLLSSSPPQPERDENVRSNVPPVKETESACKTMSAEMKPATTFHTTSVQSLGAQAPAVRRLGAKPGFNGWANRGRR